MEELNQKPTFLANIDPRVYSNTTEVKVVVVGDEGVGRTRLLATIYQGSILTPGEWAKLEPYIQKEGGVFRTFIKPFPSVGGDNFLSMSFWDTPTMERNRYRPLAYAQANVIIILVDLQRTSTMDYIHMAVHEDPSRSQPMTKSDAKIHTSDEKSLLQELEYHCPGVPILLVGNKSDVPDKSREVSKQEGKAMKTKIIATQYLEISTITGSGIVELVKVCAKLGNIHKTETSDPTEAPQPPQQQQQQQTAFPWCCSLF